MSRPRPVTIRQLPMAGVVLLGAALAGCNSEKAAAPPPQQQAQVSVVVLRSKPVAISAELPGRVAASLVAEVRPQVGGLIKSRQFREGSEVKAGDLLYEIDPAPYQAALDSAEAALARAEAAVPNAQAKVDRYRDLIRQNAISKQENDDAVAALRAKLGQDKS